MMTSQLVEQLDNNFDIINTMILNYLNDNKSRSQLIIVITQEIRPMYQDQPSKFANNTYPHQIYQSQLDATEQNLEVLQVGGDEQNEIDEDPNAQQKKKEKEMQDQIKDTYRIAKYFKEFKSMHAIKKKLQIIIKYLFQQQQIYIKSLQQWEENRTKIIAFFKNNITQLLTQNQLQNLFGYIDQNQSSNWNKIKQKSKKQLIILLNIIQHEQYQQLLIKILQANIIILYQIYNDQYKQVNMILYIINILQQQLLKLMFQTKKQLQQQLRQQQEALNLKRQSYKMKNKQIYDHQKQQTVVATSLIVDSVQLPTKHGVSKLACSINDQVPNKYQELLENVSKIRKYIFIYFDKLSSFLQYLIKYGFILMQLYEEYKYPLKPNKKLNQDPLLTPKQLLKQSKQCLTRISYLLHKMLHPSFQSMSDSDTQLVKTLASLYPQIFQVQEQSPNTDDLPYVISFMNFDIWYLGKPCLIYLIKDYLIILQDTPQLKAAKRKQPPTKMNIIHLDHTSQISLYQDKMLYYPMLLYLTGSHRSNSIFLEFKGKKLTAEEIRKFKEHQGPEDNQHRYVCSQEDLQQWQKNTTKSNMQIFKSIIQLKISYLTFNYNCQAMKINIMNQLNNNVLSSNLDEQKKNQMKIIKPIKPNEYFRTNATEMVFPEEKRIPKDSRVELEILATEWRSATEKCYIIRLSVLEYANDAQSGPLKLNRSMEGKSYLHEQINYNKISQVVYLQQRQLFEIQKHIFMIYDKYLTQPQKPKYKKQPIYYALTRLYQYRQNYLNPYFTQLSKAQIECMLTLDFFNTFFKTNIFKAKASIILNMFKMSQGLWNILIKQQKQQYNKINCCYNYNRKNGCYDCLLESQDGLGTINQVQRYWLFYYLSLSPSIEQPSQSTTLSKVLKKKKKPFCHLFAYRLQSNYIHALHQIYTAPQKSNCIHTLQQFYTAPSTTQKPHKSSNPNPKQFCTQIITHFNQIAYIKSLSQNTHQTSITNGAHYNLLKTIVKTKKMKKVNVLIYTLPTITQQEIRNKIKSERNYNKNNAQKFILIDDDTGADLEIKNQGFVCKSIANIHKDTTIKHLKFMIGQSLGLCNQYIGQFMQTFALTLVLKQQRKNQNSWLYQTFSLLFAKRKPMHTQYVVKQLHILHDFQRIYDLIGHMVVLQNYQNYYIGLKKLIKVEEIPLLINADGKFQNEDQEKIINSYYQLLELQLAEIWYKLNEGGILIEEKPRDFVKTYFSYLYTYYSKQDKKQEHLQKQTQIAWYKILLQKGIFSKKLLKYYYKLQSKQIKQQLIKQVQLLNQFNNQSVFSINKYTIINKLIKFIYQKTSWNIFIQNIQFLKSPEKCQYFPSYSLLINDTGILLLQNPETSFLKYREDLQAIPSLQNANNNSSITLLNYHDISVEMFGSVISLSRLDRDRSKKIGKICINSCRSYKIYQLIKFYKKWSELNDPQVQKQIKFNFTMQESSKMKVRKQNQRCKSMRYHITQNQIQLFFRQYFNTNKSEINQINNYQ